MKNIFIVFAVGLFILFNVSCEKTDKNGMTVDLAAELITRSIGSESGGTNQQINEAVQLANTLLDISKSSSTLEAYTVVYESKADSDLSYFYTFNYSYGLEYNIAYQRFELALACDAVGSYQSTFVSSDDTGSGEYKIHGLEPESKNYVINGTAERIGTQTTTFDGTKTYSSNLEIQFIGVNLNKQTGKIESGDAIINFTGKVSTGEEFSFEGTAVYNNDGTVTLYLNNSTYIIDLKLSIILSDK